MAEFSTTRRFGAICVGNFQELSLRQLDGQSMKRIFLRGHIVVHTAVREGSPSNSGRESLRQVIFIIKTIIVIIINS